jgi:hypothetical protein
VIEHFPNSCKALAFIPSTEKEKGEGEKKEKKKEEERVKNKKKCCHVKANENITLQVSN